MVRTAVLSRTNYRLCKRYVAEKVACAINKNSTDVVNDFIANLKIGKGNSMNDIGLRMPLNILQKHFGTNSFKDFKIPSHEITTSQLNPQHVIIHLNKNDFINDVLKNNIDVTRRHCIQNSKPCIIEFSSPNIAKPFHVGHLRSTIIGNFISNLTNFINGRVVRINYLGDWGPQFGYTILGLEQMKSDMSNKNMTIESLYNAYILANKMANNDSKIHNKAKAIFNDLECGNSTTDIKNLWNEFRSITINELEVIYKRLGIVFDEYDWESKYSKENIQDVLKRLNEIGLLKFKEDGSTVVHSNNQEITILKNDSSTLYISRDIAAALRRHEYYGSEDLFYVVDNTQSKHFYLLKSLIAQINSNINVHHIPFGRIHGMSSRKGQGILLDQLLNQAKSTMNLKRKFSETTKINSMDDNDVADVLGVSAIIINDLKQKRKKDYNFSWESALQVNGDTGIKLQYTHCRLISLEEVNSNITVPDEVVAECFTETVALDLILEICRFEDILTETNKELEACILVNYLFRLSNCINKALKVLNVKNSSSIIAQQRILLFRRARETLSTGMNILGLVPLKCM
ncbi:probable arginine--tRNA ligase, mitochondrial [Rhopalosiphum maidis]|uniref:probable arginine--tRNA ligase, mitochondrial n=1 Tax=Rhopalosiphum maidis TaxID=43146 RepID=UPI000EFFBCA5|nr:probable arginine--tRNA ligase, mitochondrial [Rhopalosiphum maidis]